jgi:hypothetical protein
MNRLSHYISALKKSKTFLTASSKRSAQIALSVFSAQKESLFRKEDSRTATRCSKSIANLELLPGVHLVDSFRTVAAAVMLKS